ncbi:hypothetical protein PIB30_044600, partial [Stylosanthes scabra]|nr:hypothetical protein [Stylosanthes scabra]
PLVPCFRESLTVTLGNLWLQSQTLARKQQRSSVTLSFGEGFLVRFVSSVRNVESS